MKTNLEVELWTSWASMLRVYSAAHGLTNSHHAVVEIGAEEIILRVDTRWLKFTLDEMTSSSGASLPFQMFEDGCIRIGVSTDEMDMSAERVVREMFAA